MPQHTLNQEHEWSIDKLASHGPHFTFVSSPGFANQEGMEGVYALLFARNLHKIQGGFCAEASGTARLVSHAPNGDRLDSFNYPHHPISLRDLYSDNSSIVGAIHPDQFSVLASLDDFMDETDNDTIYLLRTRKSSEIPVDPETQGMGNLLIKDLRSSRTPGDDVTLDFYSIDIAISANATTYVLLGNVIYRFDFSKGLEAVYHAKHERNLQEGTSYNENITNITTLNDTVFALLQVTANVPYPGSLTTKDTYHARFEGSIIQEISTKVIWRGDQEGELAFHPYNIVDFDGFAVRPQHYEVWLHKESELAHVNLNQNQVSRGQTRKHCMAHNDLPPGKIMDISFSSNGKQLYIMFDHKDHYRVRLFEIGEGK